MFLNSWCPTLSGNPVWNLRTKTPQNEQTTVPWHQDNAYLDNSSLRVLQPTAWVPLIDTNTKNGCMQVTKSNSIDYRVVYPNYLY